MAFMKARFTKIISYISDKTFNLFKLLADRHCSYIFADHITWMWGMTCYNIFSKKKIPYPKD